MRSVNRVSSRPFRVRKLQQLWRLVQESHECPLTGEPRKPELVGPGELGVTFIGHSSFLLQIGGKNVLIDPVFAKRLVVLRRQRRPGVQIADLPAIDVVFLTHAHMDHLNIPSLRAVARATRRLHGTAPVVVVPNGVEDLVRTLGFSRVETMSWWEERVVEGLHVTMTPCQHWGARMFKDTHREFGGYCIRPDGGGMSVYHSGDTAYFGGFREIGARLRPDVALMPVGAYFPDSYRSVHTSPEEAVRGFLETGAEWMVPMHYGTFRLGREPMEEPIERLAAESARLGLEGRVRVVAEGETMRISGKNDGTAETNYASRDAVGASKRA
ncbi:MBL fold metallo-hydrolase [Granulicella sibirica]|uniref:Outer membrane protein romA n=1 Tax=Granulicella sibirica TaxID=2479048 RepID=A0A4V1L548_9BACT|nr:MBL fold metallo-hydrolase [Granulicella sibirica]RXH54514.1 Outer membrane protein romA [Granulicella sibirica]